MTDHYVDFKPAEAVQYVEGQIEQFCAEATALLNPSGEINIGSRSMFSFQGSPPTICAWRMNSSGNMAWRWADRRSAHPGNWCVKQGSRVWVQDEEPAKIEHTDYAVGTPGASMMRAASPKVATHRQVALDNGWSGPWQVVDGE